MLVGRLFRSALAAAVVWPGLALANPVKSRYTTIELKTCAPMKRGKDGASWSCAGLPGYPVYVAEGDRRFFISFGAKPDARRAATQTLEAFNTIFDGRHARATVEWRFVRRAGRDLPYAAIVRYATQRDSVKGEVLVVTKVSESEACHVARIDALANPDAIALARSVADEEARRFSCSEPPRDVGAKGRSPM
jgi:hypothetical protein